MALEPWADTIRQGDILSREILLDEIKANLTSVLNDYVGRGVENEVALKQDVATLFTGEVIPSRNDWNIIINVLKVLSTQKEQGVMYDNFMKDVSDSLGVSDLIKIKEFIDMIQGLNPLSGDFSMTLNQPARYNVIDPKDTTTDAWDYATISWSLSANYLVKPTAVITFDESLSEDIDHYELTLTAGTFTKDYTIVAGAANSITVTLDWLAWFTPAQLNDVYLKGVFRTIDKRGNTVTVTRNVKYPANVPIPQGVKNYELQYRIDNSGWKTITTLTGTSYKWNTPRINGNYRYRVRALDKNGNYYGGKEGTLWTEWAYSIERYIRFIPEKPDKPNPKVSTTWNSGTVTWAAVPRAEWYEIWINSESWAKDNDSGSNNFWQRIASTSKRSITLKANKPNTSYNFYVKAGNEGGTNTGSVNAKTKARVLKKKTYKSFDYRIWRTGYDFKSQWGYITKNKADWIRDSKYLYQGEWKEPDWGTSWAKRGGGTYWAHENQAWGNHMSFIFFDYVKMRNELRGKRIQKVTISMKRASGTAALNAHGHKQATPLFLYNHNRDNSYSTTTANAFSLYRSDRQRVSNTNAQSVVSAVFDRGETERFANDKTKKLVQNIVDGHMRGLGMVKYYGTALGTHGTVADKVYMLMDKNVTIDIEYYDD